MRTLHQRVLRGIETFAKDPRYGARNLRRAVRRRDNDLSASADHDGPGRGRRHRAGQRAIGAELEGRFPEMNEGMSRPAQVFPADAMQFRGTPVGFRLLPVVLLVLFGLVLLIGSVNVAGLPSRSHFSINKEFMSMTGSIVAGDSCHPLS